MPEFRKALDGCGTELQDTEVEGVAYTSACCEDELCNNGMTTRYSFSLLLSLIITVHNIFRK